MHRIVEKIPDNKKFQAYYISINRSGKTDLFFLCKDFNYALYQENEDRLMDTKSHYNF